MLNLFVHLCLIFSFLLCSGCLGGPKVVPPEITGEGVAGASAPSDQLNTGEHSNDVANAGGMDSGVAPPGTETSGGGTVGREDEDSNTFKTSDSGLIDEDEDAGPTHEP